MKPAKLICLIPLVLLLRPHGTLASGIPQNLEDTRLFRPGTTTVAAENRPFSPQYPLWSDGTRKKRWLYLPPGTAIDGSQPGAWQFPPGTRLWKEFSYSKPVETRFIERLADGSWRFASYAWNEAGTEATLVPAEGLRARPITAAPVSTYNFPSQEDCLACHDGKEIPVLGLSLLQLSSDRDPGALHALPPMSGELDLPGLVALGLLVNLPEQWLSRPPRIAADTPLSRTALGYLHGNCGHCHNSAGPMALLEMEMDQDRADSLERVLQSLVNRPSDDSRPGMEMRIASGKPQSSSVVTRMRSADPLLQMPPLGRTILDQEAIALITQWIEQTGNPKEDTSK
ncbi:MAG TPA: hypothetical protein VFG52_02130 [Xanthomonadales bacterium]|nr:hypothetical protein [Xanthomonadales bacterium]